MSVASPARTLLGRSRKARPRRELVCDYAFRPLATLVVAALAPLRVPPPAVVVAGAAAGLAAAVETGRSELVGAALLLQLKTLLDNADGQLARASGRITAFGRYLDTECDLVVNAALFSSLGYVTGRPWLALAGFVSVTIVLSVDFNLVRLYRRELGETADEIEAGTRAARVLERVYGVVFGPQDRLVESLVDRRLRGAGPRSRLAYHDVATLSVLANLGLSTQLLALGVCLAAGAPSAYLWIAVGSGIALGPLFLRREVLLRRSRAR